MDLAYLGHLGRRFGRHWRRVLDRALGQFGSWPARLGWGGVTPSQYIQIQAKIADVGAELSPHGIKSGDSGVDLRGSSSDEGSHSPQHGIVLILQTLVHKRRNFRSKQIVDHLLRGREILHGGGAPPSSKTGVVGVSGKVQDELALDTRCKIQANSTNQLKNKDTELSLLKLFHPSTLTAFQIGRAHV